MSTRELRELAEKATPGPWVAPDDAISVCTDKLIRRAFHHNDARFIAAANPETVLALLDVAEAAQHPKVKDALDWMCAGRLNHEPLVKAADALEAALARLEARSAVAGGGGS